MAAIQLPGVVSVAQFSPPVGEPSYTQIFHDTMGDLGTPSDGFDKNMADLAALSDALNVEMVAEAAIDNLGTVLGIVGAVDLTPLDTHIANYEGTADAGNKILADAAGATAPALLELPISASFNGAAQAPPAQISVDLGTLKLNSPTFPSQIGTFTETIKLGKHGMFSVELVNGDTDIFSVGVNETVDRLGNGSGFWFIAVKPSKVGTFVAQVNTIGGVSAFLQIVTYTVKVTS